MRESGDRHDSRRLGSGEQGSTFAAAGRAGLAHTAHGRRVAGRTHVTDTACLRSVVVCAGGCGGVDAAIGHRRPCQASQLTAQLEDLANAGDQNYGWMIIRNISATSCQLTGQVGIVGLGPTGSPDTIAVSAPVAGGLLLTPHAAAVPNSTVPSDGEQVAFMVPGSSNSITTGARQGADCPPAGMVVPTTFRLDIHGADFATVPNGDPGSPNIVDHLWICQGQLSAGGPVTGQPN